MYENDLPNLSVGQTATIHFNAYTDKLVTGRISEIDPILDPTIRTAKVRVQVKNPGFMKIGMFVTASFVSQKQEPHIVVPANAIAHLHDQDFVYVAKGNGSFALTKVVGGAMLPGQSSGRPIRPPVRPAGGEQRSRAAEHGDAIMGSLVDFALKNRFLVLILAVLLFAWGIISFSRAPCRSVS